MSDTPTSDSDYLSPPVQRAARLLRQIADGDPVTNMARTARALDINRTTLLRLLHTLEAERLIEPRGSDIPGWRIGRGLIALAAHAFYSDDMVQAAIPVLTHLAETLGLSTHLGQLDGREIVYLVRRTPNLSFVSNIRVGSRLPAHATTMGRIILAHMPQQDVARIFADQPLEAVTAHTAVNLPQLRLRLDQDREAGLAWSDEFFEAGISSVAAPILDAAGQPVAAINISGQVAAFAGEERRAEIGRAVVAAAEEISRQLGWSRRNPHPNLKVVA
ncbi:MAG: IclR family transcriptional regulator [Acetobacteraceae bacterium]|nr:IclR family transcriptional regulator [Acetobacteraceae bacterium]